MVVKKSILLNSAKNRYTIQISNIWRFFTKTTTIVSNEQLAKEYVDGVFEQLKNQNSY